MKPNKTFRKKDYGPPINRYIRAKQVRCIDKDNNNLGVINITEALKLAEQTGLDLVQVSENDEIPTCRILDYGKYKYEQSKKKKAAAKKQRESLSKIKEIMLRPSTDSNDLKIKASKTEEFLNEGHKVKVTVKFKGRELSHKDVGVDTLNTFLEMLGENISLLNEPSMDGRNLSAMVVYKKKDIKEDIKEAS